MMTRGTVAAAFSMRDLAPFALAIIMLGPATLGFSWYGDGSRPVSDFLNRAQSEAEARGFEELLGTLGGKPAETQPATPIAHVDKPQVAAMPLPASAPSVKPAPQSIASPPQPAVKPQVAALQMPSIGSKHDVRKPRTVARRSTDDWVRKGSSLLRLVRARY
jgi:hypothetical protein